MGVGSGSILVKRTRGERCEAVVAVVIATIEAHDRTACIRIGVYRRLALGAAKGHDVKYCGFQEVHVVAMI